MTENWFGIPREEIDWHPTIDYEKCSGCISCMDKCSHGVFTAYEGKPKVVEPKNCVVGCTGCQSVCPEGAITHPSKEYLKELTKRDDFEIGCNCGGN
ncbi:MAG: ATP-binding protein [Candidatus Nanoarchaeia archaeon]